MLLLFLLIMLLLGVVVVIDDSYDYDDEVVESMVMDMGVILVFPTVYFAKNKP